MAMVGVLGDIVFNVSSETVETVSNMKWSQQVTVSLSLLEYLTW